MRPKIQVHAPKPVSMDVTNNAAAKARSMKSYRHADHSDERIKMDHREPPLCQFEELQHTEADRPQGTMVPAL